jgi:hypothetical protein
LTASILSAAPISWQGKPQKGQEQKPARQLPAVGEEKPKQRPGPTPGDLRRFEAADRELFPQLEQLMTTRHISLWAAAQALAEEGKIDGVGISTQASRAKRLVKLYGREKKRAGKKGAGNS